MSNQLYRIVLSGSFHPGALATWEEYFDEARDEGLLVKVEPTDRICVAHGTSEKIALSALSNSCHEYTGSYLRCKMVDVVRMDDDE